MFPFPYIAQTMEIGLSQPLIFPFFSLEIDFTKPVLIMDSKREGGEKRLILIHSNWRMALSGGASFYKKPQLYFKSKPLSYQDQKQMDEFD